MLGIVNPPFFLRKMVGAVRFELTTSCTRNKRASQATLRPDPRPPQLCPFPPQHATMKFLFFRGARRNPRCRGSPAGRHPRVAAFRFDKPLLHLLAVTLALPGPKAQGPPLLAAPGKLEELEVITRCGAGRSTASPTRRASQAWRPTAPEPAKARCCQSKPHQLTPSQMVRQT